MSHEIFLARVIDICTASREVEQERVAAVVIIVASLHRVVDHQVSGHVDAEGVEVAKCGIVADVRRSRRIARALARTSICEDGCYVVQRQEEQEDGADGVEHVDAQKGRIKGEDGGDSPEEGKGEVVPRNRLGGGESGKESE